MANSAAGLYFTVKLCRPWGVVKEVGPLTIRRVGCLETAKELMQRLVITLGIPAERLELCLGTTKLSDEEFVNDVVWKSGGTSTEIRLYDYFPHPCHVELTIVSFGQGERGETKTLEPGIRSMLQGVCGVGAVHSSSGMKISISLSEAGQSVRSLKLRVEQLHSVPAARQRVVLGRSLCEDRQHLSSLLRSSAKKARTIYVVDDRPPDINAQKMNLHVQTMTGKSIPLMGVSRGARIDQVKDMIQDVEKIRLDEQRLMYAGVELEDRRTLASYTIHSGCTIRLELKTHGQGDVLSTGIVESHPMNDECDVDLICTISVQLLDKKDVVINTGNVIKLLHPGGAFVSGSCVYDAARFTLEFTPHEPLFGNTTYSVLVGTESSIYPRIIPTKISFTTRSSVLRLNLKLLHGQHPRIESFQPDAPNPIQHLLEVASTILHVDRKAIVGISLGIGASALTPLTCVRDLFQLRDGDCIVFASKDQDDVDAPPAGQKWAEETWEEQNDSSVSLEFEGENEVIRVSDDDVGPLFSVKGFLGNIKYRRGGDGEEGGDAGAKKQKL